MNLKKIKIIAVLGIFLLSFISHFAYELFPNIIFSFIFPVNESIWEHMKIIFTSTLIYGIIDYLLLKKYKIKYNNFPFQLYFTSLIGIPIYLVIYLPLYKLFGENMIISISLLLLVYIITQIVSYNILKEKKLKILNIIIIPVILLSYLGFIYLTYNPPHTHIFYDTKENKYSINDYIYLE
ncbi:MAG: DUF6512 family protein [Bacilli bacterium]